MSQTDFHSQFQEKQPHNKFRFKCQKGCDYCCKLNDIALYPFDIMELCSLLGISTKELHAKYTRFEFDSEANILRCYLITSPKCMFFDSHNACTVYSSRPVRCRLFPVARVFNSDGSIQYYLPREQCIGFQSGKKQTIQEWINEQGISESDELFTLSKQWNNFINELKNNNKLPLTDKFFIVFFKKIFYDFDNDLVKAIKPKIHPGVEVAELSIKEKMSHLYELAKVYLLNIDKWKQGYEEFFDNKHNQL